VDDAAQEGLRRMDGVFNGLEFAANELLLFSALWFLIGAIDDFCVDLIWLLRAVYRRQRYYRKNPPIRIDQLKAPETQGLLAVFVATWQEAAVIGQMLGRCSAAWQNTESYFRIYVGCYRNDADGIEAVMNAAQRDPSIRVVIGETDGPTTKADCLNQLWQALIRDELKAGTKAKAIILHDAEDMVDPHELRVFDRLIERNQVVQLPVIPVRVSGSLWVSGHYCDEFAEAHGKSLVVREAIGAALPLAGVGCAIDRIILGRIALANNSKPFDCTSLTEDYELGLRIGATGGRTILARITDMSGQLIGTRACFPSTISTAVRQKARWLTGIALAGWDRMGWQGGVAECWMRVRDRRAIFAAVVLFAAYCGIFIGGLLMLGQLFGLYVPRPVSHFIRILLVANFGFLLWRLASRAFFVGQLYGAQEAILSIPRIFVGNIIALMAARRACTTYARHCLGGPLSWDKTAHIHFPDLEQVDGKAAR
jgi:bacteriophage N4 adsorption protein B